MGSQVGLRKHHYEPSWWRWWNSRWAISNSKRWCCESAALNMAANLENSAVATRLESSVFIPIPKKGCWGPAWGTPPMAKVMSKEAWHMQRRDQASGNPLFPSIYPKTRVLYGELSPITISLRGVNLQLQLIKIPGRDKSVSTYELWRFSGLSDQARLAARDCLQPPNCERHGMLLKLSKYRLFWEVRRSLV